jgi:Skp family chaperone for outer membrane proteins
MSGHGHVDPSNKRIALLISVLAAVLALSETLGKSAQTASLSYNIEASNLWSFFQAKTIRMTTMRTAGESLEAELPQASRTEAREALEKRIAEWKKTAARYDSEPETQEGRKELAARAKIAEGKRDRTLAAYHHYELASAALQIAIVLASAEVITGVVFLTWLSGGLGLIGVIFCAIGLLAPTAVHLF